ncbi:MAG: hypothetical protein ACK56I_02750, partial [bacterium]
RLRRPRPPAYDESNALAHDMPAGALVKILLADGSHHRPSISESSAAISPFHAPGLPRQRLKLLPSLPSLPEPGQKNFL